jgi:imidazole glycerol-phosphate synthase subunit HisH
MTAGPAVTIIDYGMGNLRSVEKALAAVGASPRISADPDAVRKSERLVLPGVGAFGDAMANLKRGGLDQAVLDAVTEGVPLLGLCLGLQLLFSESEEFGRNDGLSLIPGRVRKLNPPGLHVPHVGWNQLESIKADPLLDGVADGSYFYFVHSYIVEPEDGSDVLSWTEYGGRFCSIARRRNVWGAQFHPEKSQDAGRRLLHNFVTGC